VTNTHGCTDTSQVWLKVRPPLKVKAVSNSALICNGANVIASATGSGGYNPGYAYSWPAYGVQGSVFAHTVTGSGWIKVRLEDGCSAAAYDSFYVKVANGLTADFTPSPTDGKVNEPVLMQNRRINASSYRWDFGDGTNGSSFSPVHVYSDTGTYKITLVAFDDLGCTDTAFALLKIRDPLKVYIPNSFTPNGDDHNDTLFVRGVGIEELKFRIYNRWGELIFETDSPEIGWDGTFKGIEAPIGEYIYTLYAKGFREKKYQNGQIFLLR